MQIILPLAFILYCHALKWLCLGRLVACIQIQLIFLVNDTLQDPLRVGAYCMYGKQSVTEFCLTSKLQPDVEMDF